ncbi:Inosine-uridine nucleoside N-ribohydrolase [Gulbenkiania indica]|uniref:Inosine-uridine nucleoside N-ribohydrolase n=1 Tax=Gulbenkiania indica TaxID=375574 RepID=A0A0K6GVE4_9NEIS|nr:nucleoside hydrolase [Gulbenkiania indica]CUA82513.1 Inosine-uridine nucleoside N-ribohydrolase [Gulbenkiania indica]
MTRIPVIFDTDPGQDDAVAILFMLGAHEEIQPLALTAVAGNVGLHHTSRNARIVCEWAGRPDIPVHAGADRPLLVAPVTAEHVHGKTGLDGVPLHEPSMALADEHAVDFMVRTLHEAAPGSITLCPVGPLTNIALALRRDPGCVRGIREIVLMGGAYFEAGNITPAAEFNIYADPHAAQIVLQCGAPITMLPLDVTHQAQTTAERVSRWRALPNRCGPLAANIVTSLERYDVQKFGMHGAPMHDPCVIAYLLAPELFAGRRVNVEVETTSPLTLGATVVDWWGTSGRPANVHWINQVDADGLFARMTECLARLP